MKLVFVLGGFGIVLMAFALIAYKMGLFNHSAAEEAETAQTPVFNLP